MNILSFVDLMRLIYGKSLPNLKKIQKKGLLAVKIAQHFALRIDFLDEKVCQHLSKLFRATEPVQSVTVREMLKPHVSKDWFSAFSSIEEAPFASASIGQIHRAILQDGTAVVIKIIREDFHDQFLKDIESLERSLKLALFFLPKLKKVFDPLAILEHIREYTLSELNLLNEIRGGEKLEEIRAQYKDAYPLENLRFPSFHSTLSGKSVLVSDYIPGATYDELLTNKGLTYEELLELFSLHGLFLFGAGTFHGDMHPGNVILTPQKELFFVDTGALSSINEKIRTGLFAFFMALSQYDYSKASQCIHQMSEKSLSPPQLDRFHTSFLSLYEDFNEKSVAEISLTRKMMETIKLGVNSGMAFDRGMFPIIKSLMYLDGMVLRCNPQAILLKDMRPFIEKFQIVMER